MNSTLATKLGLASAGLVAGAVLAGTVGAQAATPSPAPSGSSTQDAHPGNGADGVPESQEHPGDHGGHGGHGGLDLSGTVTAVGSSSVTIKTSTGSTTTYSASSNSDIDKNGEASLKDLAVGDAVTYSVESGTTTIDKLHAGDEAKDRPNDAPDAPDAPDTSAPSTTSSPSTSA